MKLSPAWQPPNAIFDVFKNCCIFIGRTLKMASRAGESLISAMFHYCQNSLCSVDFLKNQFPHHKMQNFVPERASKTASWSDLFTPLSSPGALQDHPGLEMRWTIHAKINLKSTEIEFTFT